MKGYKLCKSCGQPMLKKGQRRKGEHDYRHARGCPADKSAYAKKMEKWFESKERQPV